MIYFYSYIVVVKLVFLNLFIAVILEGFEMVNEQEGRTLNSELIDSVKIKWTRYDPNATGFIKMADFPAFLADLGKPLGFVAATEEAREEFIV